MAPFDHPRHLKSRVPLLGLVGRIFRGFWGKKSIFLRVKKISKSFVNGGVCFLNGSGSNGAYIILLKANVIFKKTTKKTGFITYFAVLAFLLDVTNTHAILDYIHGALKSPNNCRKLRQPLEITPA